MGGEKYKTLQTKKLKKWRGDDSLTTDFVGESQSKEVCMNFSHSRIICLFLYKEKKKKNQRKCPDVHSIEAVEFNNGAIMILNHTASTAEYWLAFESLHQSMFFAIFFLPV